MEPDERAPGAREGGAAETLRPAEGMLEAAESAPLETKVEQRRETIGKCSVDHVNRPPLL